MVFMGQAGVDLLAYVYDLHRADQYHRILVIIFESRLCDLSVFPIVRARTDMEQPCQLRIVIRCRACVGKNQAVENLPLT